MLKETLLWTCLCCALLNVAHAEKYPPKNVTIEIEKGDMVYCHYGNPNKPNVVCDSIELKDSFTMVDRFMQMLEFGK